MAVGVEEDTLAHRRRELQMQGHLVNSDASMVFVQALRDLQIPFHRALHANDAALLGWYTNNSSKVFAMLTNDSDFLMCVPMRRVTNQSLVSSFQAFLCTGGDGRASLAPAPQRAL